MQKLKHKSEMTFEDLKKIFEVKNGSIIELNKNYTIDVYHYNNVVLQGNFITKGSPKAHMIFRDDKVEIAPCKKKYWLLNSKSTVTFTLDDDIMKLKNLIHTDFLTVLADYMAKC